MSSRVVCEICKKDFEIGRLMLHVKKVHHTNSEDYYNEYMKPNQDLNCPICEKKRKFNGFKKGYLKTCGNRSCSNKLINIESKEKQIEGCKKRNEKWRNEIDSETGLTKQQMIIQKGEEKRTSIRSETAAKQSIGMKNGGNEKLKNTMQEHYGVDNPMDIDSVKEKVSIGVKEKMPQTLEKMKKTIQDKYGVDNFAQTPERKEQIRIEVLEKAKPRISIYFKENNLTLLSNINKYKNQNDPLQFKCNECGNLYNKSWWDIRTWWKCRTCDPLTSQEKEIKKFFNNYGITNFIVGNKDIIINPKSGRSMQLDFYFPDKNKAIEFNGMYWHCSKHYDNDYHIRKTNLCETKGIQLVHIFEDDWLFKKDICKSMIKRFMKINSDIINVSFDNCTISIIKHNEKNKFLEDNHILGKNTSFLNIGIYYKDELISIMTLIHSKRSDGFNKKDEHWEISRLCNKKNYKIIEGTLNIFLNYLKSNYNEWSKLLVYCDKRWFTRNNIFEKNGFVYKETSKPSCYYLHTSRPLQKFHWYNFLKDKLQKLDFYDPSLSRDKNLKQNGYETIHDCGHFRYELNR